MNSIRKISTFIKPYRVLAILAPLFMVLEVAMDLNQPRLLEKIVDVGVANLDMPLIIQTGLIMIFCALVGLIGGAGNTILTMKVAMSTSADIRNALFRKVLSFSFANLDEIGSGELITRLTNDVTQVQEVIMLSLRVLVRAPLMVIGSVIMAILTSPGLSWLVLVLVPVLSAVLAWGINRSYPLFVKVQTKLDRLNTVMQENLAGVRVVKAFVRSDFEKKRFASANQELVKTSLDVAQIMVLIMPAISIAINMSMVGVVWFGGLQAIQGSLKVGQIMAFINYLSQLIFSLITVGMLLIRVSRAAASAERIQKVLESEPQIRDLPETVKGGAARGKVVFDHVNFSYDGKENAVLKDINLVIEPGQLVAILGTTGSGKSSLINLIPRFYDVSSGSILIDGQDVRRYKNEDLRRMVGMALQETVLFSGTIRDNIRYGRPNATDQEVIAAAQAAQAEEFISALPERYDTILGQRGVNLSGGQKQRLAIARALLTRPVILILDDSTSSVDVDTEVRIQEALAEIMKNRTSIVIAQRISTVLNADKIIVLDEGEIAAQGTHRELMASSSIYSEIYDLQLGNGVQHGK